MVEEVTFRYEEASRVRSCLGQTFWLLFKSKIAWAGGCFTRHVVAGAGECGVVTVSYVCGSVAPVLCDLWLWWCTEGRCALYVNEKYVNKKDNRVVVKIGKHDNEVLFFGAESPEGAVCNTRCASNVK